MSTAAFIWVVISCLSLGITLARHGEPRTGNYSFWASSIAASTQLALLYWGGFFNKVL